MGGPPGLGRQRRPLGHAEAVLLVGDHQAQIGVVHPLGQEGVGADEQIQLPRRQGGEQLLPGPALHRPGEQAHPQAGLLQQRGERSEVLLGQQLGGGHEGALAAVLRRQPGAVGRHHGLAGANVPLYQPVHGGAGGHVGGDLVHHPPLGPGEGEGQQGQKFLHRGNGKGHPRRLIPPGAQQGHAAGEVEQLLKDQPPPGQLQGLLVPGEVDVPAGELRRRQGVLPAQRPGKHLLQLPGALVHAPPGQPGKQVVGDAVGQGVNRQDAAGEAHPVRALAHRVGHLPPAGRALHLPVDDVGLPGAQGVLHVGLVEKGGGEAAGVVHQAGLHQLQPLADAGEPGGLRHQQLQAHRNVHRRGGHGGKLPPILVASGVAAQQILHRHQPQLLQAPGPGRADAGQGVQPVGKPQCHGAPSSPPDCFVV